jgi:tripartite-type tricarboxylate transporter receptor subunit TctC
LYKKISFDPAKSFAPVSLIAGVPIALAVSTQLEVKSVKELIALAKAKPGSLTFGSSGNGSTNHLTGELFKSLADIDIVHVPYKGAAPAMNDLISGHIHMMFDNLPAVLAQARNKRIQILAMASTQRIKALPDTPTVAESGVAGFEANSWFGLVAPAKTPMATLNKLSTDVSTVLGLADVQARFEQIGAQPMALSGAAFGKFLDEERLKWSGIIRKSGAKVD